MEARERQLAYAAWAAVCFFWGTTYLAIRVGVESLPPLLFAGVRFLAAGVLLTGWLRFRGEELPRGRDWLTVSIVGLALLGGGNSMVVWAEKTVPSGVAALLIAMTPFWMTGLEALLPGGDRLSRQGIFGLLIGFGGLIVLMLPQLAAGHVGSQMLLGFGALELGCLSWAVGSVYSRRTPVQVKPLMAAALQMVIAGAALVLLGSVMGEWPAFHLNARNGSALLYLIAVGSILAFGCYTYALQKLPISTVSLYAYVNPIIAVFLGWALLREPVGWREVVSLVIILGGVMVVQRARVRKGDATKSREAAVPAGKLATDS